MPVPGVVRGLAGNDPVEPVWQNEVGGLTFAVLGEPRRFVKWSPAGAPVDLGAEAERLTWARRFTPVPTVLAHGSDGDQSWLVTSAIDGEDAVRERWLRQPAVAVRAIATGLRRFHDALPVVRCPFTWSVDERRASVARRAISASDRVGSPDGTFGDLTVGEALRRLADAPATDRLVVCHGDPCAPNTLIDDAGACAGHVDLGALGVADRWADLAVATWSLEWNYGPGWDRLFLETYGIDPDPERTAYYRLLWTLGD